MFQSFKNCASETRGWEMQTWIPIQLSVGQHEMLELKINLYLRQSLFCSDNYSAEVRIVVRCCYTLLSNSKFWNEAHNLCSYLFKQCCLHSKIQDSGDKKLLFKLPMPLKYFKWIWNISWETELGSFPSIMHFWPY